jgi:hypothetical protein
MRTAPALFSLLLVACASTSTNPTAVVRRYLSARTLDEAVSTLDPGYRLWFGSRTGEGIDRASTARMLEWDFALHPRHRIEAITAHGDEVTVRVHEDNDFSLLLGFPGWDATSTYIVSPEGRIVSQLYAPTDGQDWRPYLDAPLPWLREHHPDALARVFPDGKLSRSAESAREWVALLREWRAATGQSDPTR